MEAMGYLDGVAVRKPALQRPEHGPGDSRSMRHPSAPHAPGEFCALVIAQCWRSATRAIAGGGAPET